MFVTFPKTQSAYTAIKMFLRVPPARKFRRKIPVALSSGSARLASSSSDRPSISHLLQHFKKLPDDSIPISLASTLSDFAAREMESVASGMASPSPCQEEYEDVKLECSSFINSFFQLQMCGQSTSDAVYSPQVLDLYDAYVWRFNSPFLWRISESECQSIYERNISDTIHCEVAVGTGLFLKKLSSPRKPRELALVDLNENSLFTCGERVDRQARKESLVLKLSKTVADITTVDSIPEVMKGRYRSVAANFLLHCLHGESLLEKKAAVEGCAALMSSDDDACFFGSTILGGDLRKDSSNAGEAALQTLKLYNEWGIFGNNGDNFQDLKTILEESFEHVEVWRSGYCGIWTAQGPKRRP